MPTEIVSTQHGDVKIQTPIQNIGVGEGVDASLHALLPNHKTIDIKGTRDPDKIAGLLKADLIEALALRTNIPITDPKIIADNPQLQLLMGACRNPKVDTDLVMKNGIWVLRSNANVKNVARCVMTQLRSAGLGLSPTGNALRGNEWPKTEAEKDGFDLHGKTIGIVGFGEIGKQVAIEALSEGMKVVFYNDGQVGRQHDRDMDEFPALVKRFPGYEHSEIGRTGSIDELMERADIATIHTNSENWGGKSQKGIITAAHLRKLQRDKDRLGIFVNFARADLVEPDYDEILKLLQDGVLRYFITDVFDPKKEGKEKFKFPVNPQADQAWRLITSSHMGGSGPGVAEATAKDIAERLLPSYEQGRFERGVSHSYQRNSLDPVSLANGAVAFTCVTGTGKGVWQQLIQALNSTGYSIITPQTVGDHRAGTKSEETRFPAVPRTLIVDANGVPYDEALRNIAGQVITDVKELTSFRPIPTNQEQKDYLAKIKPGSLFPNLPAV